MQGRAPLNIFPQLLHGDHLHPRFPQPAAKAEVPAKQYAQGGCRSATVHNEQHVSQQALFQGNVQLKQTAFIQLRYIVSRHRH